MMKENIEKVREEEGESSPVREMSIERIREEFPAQGKALVSSPPQIGDIVLFRIAPEVVRPMLVIAVEEVLSALADYPFGSKPAYLVSGELLVLGDTDRRTAWCIRHFNTLARDTDYSKLVRGAAEGSGVGQWSRRQ